MMNGGRGPLFLRGPSFLLKVEDAPPKADVADCHDQRHPDPGNVHVERVHPAPVPAAEALVYDTALGGLREEKERRQQAQAYQGKSDCSFHGNLLSPLKIASFMPQWGSRTKGHK
jgi:hypothetical protein